MRALIFGAVALLLIGSGGGWLIKHRKDGAEIALVNSQNQDLESRNSQLVASNARYAIDIEGMRKGVAVGSRRCST